MNLAVVIDAALDSVRPSAESKGIRIEHLIDPVAGVVSGDPDRLQQVVWNLLSNAVKFTPKGGLISVTLARVDSHVEICVCDSGLGINAEFLPHVFDRFRQADSSTTRHHGGLGLGLSIVKQLVELHGGSTRAESAGAGLGASFIVCLPVVAEGPEREETSSAGQSASLQGAFDHTASLAGLKILVIDDEADARELIQRVLVQCLAEVRTAASADEGIELLAAQRPDVIISDIGMPEKDGYQFMRHVRSLALEEGGRIPAIALTAFARSEDRTRAMLAGYQVHLSKPVEPRELVATVASLARAMGISTTK